MHVTVDPLVLLVALAFLVPWAAAWRRSWAWYYRLRTHLLRWRLQRRERAAVLVYTGPIAPAACAALTQRIVEVRGRPLVLVLDTPGGDIQSALQVVHAVAAHDSPVTIRVPDMCLSAGTIIAAAGDHVVMGPHAFLGYTDAICHADPAELRAAMMVAADRAGTNVDMLRAKSTLERIVADIARARVARGVAPALAHQLAERLTMTEVDHWAPLFPEDVVELGLDARVDRDDCWYLLVCLLSWSHT